MRQEAADDKLINDAFQRLLDCYCSKHFTLPDRRIKVCGA